MNTQLTVDLSPYVEKYQSARSSGVKKPQRPESIDSVSEKKKTVLKAALAAWEKYKASPQGLELEAAISISDFPQIQAKVEEIKDSSAFEEVLELMDDIGLDAASFSIGIDFEVEFIIGFAATFGIAIGVGDSKGVESSTFLSIAIDEGIDEGALVGAQFGVWSSAPSDMGGYSWGTSVDLGLGAEVGGTVYYSASGGLQGITVSAGVGEEDGIDEMESYTFILDTKDNGGDGYLRPSYQPRKSNLLLIKTVNCVHPRNDKAGNANEVYFTFQADGQGNPYFYPTYDYMSLQQDDRWGCGRSVWFDQYVTVHLYDEDDLSSSDPLGDFTLNISELPLNTIKTFSSTKDYSSWDDNVEFTLDVELIYKPD